MSGVWVGVSVLVGLAALYVAAGYRPGVDDAHIYWAAPYSTLYSAKSLVSPDYFYSPAFLWLIAPLKALPFPLFRVVWCALILIAIAWLSGRWLFLPVMLSPLPGPDFYYGNINALMATAIVLGFRWPATWAFPILTKGAPGIGLLWYAVRREWRQLAIAAGFTGGVAAIGFALNPDQWLTWVRFLASQPAVATTLNYTVPGPPWPIRLAISVAVLVLGARLGWRWVVPLSAALVLPWWPYVAVLLLGSVKLLRDEFSSAAPDRLYRSRVPQWRFRPRVEGLPHEESAPTGGGGAPAE